MKDIDCDSSPLIQFSIERRPAPCGLWPLDCCVWIACYNCQWLKIIKQQKVNFLLSFWRLY